MKIARRQLGWLLLPALLAAPLAQAGPGRPPALPEEEMRVERLPAPDGQRLYVTDFVFHHMVDGRVHVLDGRAGRYLGMVPTGFGALTTVSPDGRALYVATTYYPRLYRGQRSDLVEIHDAETLELQAEIEIPPKRAQAASYRSMLVSSADGRFLYVQNATPATSVSVIDLQRRQFVGEVQTPGCWSIQAWPQGHRFSALCGDGTLLTVTLDEQGQVSGRERSAAFFDPDRDPIYIHPESQGEQRYFISYHGNVYPVRLSGEQPVFADKWSLLNARDRRQAWRPGGMQVSALHSDSHTLFVNMHDRGEEGSHKNPSKEIWAFDLRTQQRTARIPSNGAVSLTASQGADGRLYALNPMTGGIAVHRIAGGRYPLERSIPQVGETAVFMEVR